MDFEKLAQSDNPQDLEKVLTAYERRSQLLEAVRLAEGKTNPSAVFARAYAQGLLADTARYPIVSPLVVLRAHQNIIEGNLKVRWRTMMEAREDGATWVQIAEATRMGMGSNAGHIARTWYINALATAKDLGDREARARAVIDDPADETPPIDEAVPADDDPVDETPADPS